MRNIPCRHLVLILGDQLDETSSALEDFDRVQDVVLMVEAFEESTHVWSHKVRTTLFLSAMRHFAWDLEQRGLRVDYHALNTHGDKTLAAGLCAAIATHEPERIIGVEPGDIRVRAQFDLAINSIAYSASSDWATGLKLFINWRKDTHFLCRLPQFRNWAGKSASLRMEFFYRSMRGQYKVLMEGDPLIGSQRRLNIDPPCRSNIDPGRVAGFCLRLLVFDCEPLLSVCLAAAP